MIIRQFLTRAGIASAVVAGVIALPAAAFAGSPTVPFSDPNQVGLLTFCNEHGQPVTSGSMSTMPFVWRAVSSDPAPAGYSQATLVLYQPIQYEAPQDWSGYQLTDNAIFSNPAHPMAQATYADAPLLWPDQSVPPYWNGLYQLRMIFSAPNKMPWDSSYPAAVIRVSGQRWTLLQGGRSACGGGTAVSAASILLPKSETAVPQSPAKATTSSSGNKDGGSSSSSATGAKSGGSSAASGGSTSRSANPASALPAGRSTGGGSSTTAVVLAAAAGAIGALLLAGAVLLVVLRRRRQQPAG